MNDAVWQSKKDKLTEEANSLERQLEGVQKKLAGVREKLAFMAEIEAEANPPLFPTTDSPKIKMPVRRPVPPPEQYFGNQISTFKSPPLSVAAMHSALKLGRFTKRALDESMRTENLGMAFNSKSLDRILKDMLKDGSLSLVPSQGRTLIYEYKILPA